MPNRLFTILIFALLATAGGGCASNFLKPRTTETNEPRTTETTKPHQEILLPRQTGSHLERRIVVDDESGIQEPKKKSEPPPKKQVKAEQTEPELAEPEKPEKPKKSKEPEQTATPPDRFR